MSDDVVIWHNPRCSKSRQALALLRENGVEPRIVEYLKTPPDAAAIEAVRGMLGVETRGMMRVKESVYKELSLGGEGVGDADLVRAMAENPILIERPVVIAGGKAALGRPPGAVLEIL